MFRQIVWIASSRADITAMPGPVKASFGARLFEVQVGGAPHDMKPLPQFGAGVYELRERFVGNADRLVYVLSLEAAIYVVHVFVKKSTSGISLPRPDADLIQARLRRAQLGERH